MTDFTNPDITELRVFSQISESINYFTIDNAAYACIAGYIVPYNVSCALILWNITGSNIYGNIFDETDVYKTIIDLNVNFDDRFVVFESYHIKKFLNTKIYNIMSSWSPDDFSSIIDKLYEKIQPIS